MTERMVSVPVEPTPKMLAATWDHEIDKNGGVESQNTRNARIWSAMLTAAPVREEGGAVSDDPFGPLDNSQIFTTPPAPEAEKLRVAAEALEKIAMSAGKHGERGTTGEGHQQSIQSARQALAALQQEDRPDA